MDYLKQQNMYALNTYFYVLGTNVKIYMDLPKLERKNEIHYIQANNKYKLKERLLKAGRHLRKPTGHYLSTVNYFCTC